MIADSIIYCSLILLLFILSNRKVYRYLLLNKYKSILDLLDYFLEKSYKVIYNDQLLAFVMAGSSNIPKNELETIERNFIKLSVEMMGNPNYKDFINFFGDEKTLINNMVVFFRRQLETDAITKLINANMKL